MLTENDILTILAKHLEKQGFVIKQHLNTHQTGYDLIAENEKEILFIEAKGETSSKETARAGKPFDSRQIKSQIGQAILASFKVISEKPGGTSTKAAIALPNNKGHRKLIDRILPALNQSMIKVYMVDSESVLEL